MESRLTNLLTCADCLRPLWGAIRKKEPEPLLKNLVCLPCFEKAGGVVNRVFMSNSESGGCPVPGCIDVPRAQGFCLRHYARVQYWCRKTMRARSYFKEHPELLNLETAELKQRLGIE
ncbi:hypothetical protein LCGC14_2322530 [marine sediment metagenome]|uniref:Uncharacterized protein n=1 Tax=marine sediment metagenome TaxID=412755 RepID=A0A0F9CHF2_9ZZZZ